MTRLFHELRKHEEGQALVLAAISLLILTLCVLATVNLAYAADQKIRLQNAADAAAYNTAAYQARALNVLAYSNRAQVVHYATQMNLMAMLSYLIFCLGTYTVLFNLLSLIPIPPLIAVLQWALRILQVIVKIVDYAIMIAMPIIDAVNYMTSVAQFAVASAMATRVVSLPDEELAAADRQGRFQAAQPFQTVFSALSALNWVPGTGIVNALPVPSLTQPTQFDDKYNRAVMVEIANSARNAWTAYGGKNIGGFTILGIPRHMNFHFNFGVDVTIGKVARTEWGAFQRSGGGMLSNLSKPNEQIWSIDRFQFAVKIFGFGVKFLVDAKAWADRKLPMPGGQNFGPDIQPQCPRWVPKRICEAALKPVTKLLQQGVSKALQGMMQLPKGPLFHFGQVPYARFKPNTSSNSLFNQPPVMIIAQMPTAKLVAGGKPFMSSFGVRIGSLSAGGGVTDSAYAAERSTARSKRGFVNSTDFRPSNVGALPGLSDGLYAVSSALTYYHRPGDWREPPNLFNPFWGAKLMPITDHPQIARFGVLTGAVSQFLVH